MIKNNGWTIFWYEKRALNPRGGTNWVAMFNSSRAKFAAAWVYFQFMEPKRAVKSPGWLVTWAPEIVTSDHDSDQDHFSPNDRIIHPLYSNRFFEIKVEMFMIELFVYLCRNGKL